MFTVNGGVRPRRSASPRLAGPFRLGEASSIISVLMKPRQLWRIWKQIDGDLLLLAPVQ